MEYQPSFRSRDFFAYLTLVGGVLFDQFTTRYGLYIGYSETNPVASWLMSAGLWSIVDFMLLVSIIGLTIYVSEKLEKVRRVVFIYPFFFGLVRLYAGIHNLGLII